VISVGNQEVVTTIVSIKKDSINATDFDIPKDFQEMKTPLGAAPPPVENPAASPSATP
jgi:hypothetical protein